MRLREDQGNAGAFGAVDGVDALLDEARRVLAAEQRAIALLGDAIDPGLVDAAAAIACCSGRTVVSGIGKSGIAARKLAATLSSLGRPAHFLHAADALHGDLGALGADDVLVAISVSGKSRELLQVAAHANRIGATTVAITASLYAPLARACGHVLLTECPDDDHNAAPMASTIASIALGDAMAALAAQLAGGDAPSAGQLHPGGALGQRRRSIDTIAHGGDRVPLVPLDADATRILTEISAKGFGITGVVDAEGKLAGTISDGDVRRHFDDLRTRTAGDVMETHPVTLPAGADIGDALGLMREHRVSALFVVRPGTLLVERLVHVQDLLRAGVI